MKDRNVLRNPWRKFALRVQNIKRNHDSPAIIQLTVLVNAGGNPIFWLDPKVRTIEPRLDFDVAQDSLTIEQLNLLLELVVRGG